MNSAWSIRLVRALFFALFVFTGLTIALGLQLPAWTGALTGAAVMGLLLLLDTLFARFTLRDFSHATFGLAIGLFCAWLITRIGIFQLGYFQSMAAGEAVQNVVEILVYASLAFFGVSFALRSDRDQFAFLIPYVRFRRDSSEGEPLLLAADIVIDGRIVEVAQTGFLGGTMVVPRSVLDELRRLAESTDQAQALRGRRGMEVMEKLRALGGQRLSIHEDPPGSVPRAEAGDAELVGLARELNARLLTNDAGLAKVARLRGIPVLSFYELSQALQPQFQAGDELQLTLVKPGKEKHQAVGYLADGTMIVVNQAASFVGQNVDVTISGSLPTTAGRLIFAELRR